MIFSIVLFAITIATGCLTIYFALHSIRAKITVKAFGDDMRGTAFWGLITSILTIVQLIMALQQVHITNFP